MFSIIPLPENFVTTITGNIGTIISDLGGYIALILGILLVGVVLEIIIGAIKK
jgi:hypothetical protein